MLLSREIAVLTNAIAFNFLVCLFPLLLVLAAFSQRYQGSGAGRALIILLQELIPFGHQAIAASLRNLTRIGRGLELLSLLLIVWGSSGIFMPVEMALNKAWGGRPHRHFLWSRVLAFLMTLAGGVVALASVALTVAARSYSKEWPMLAGYGAKASAFLLTFCLFFLIYRIIPDAKVGSRVASKAALWAGLSSEALKYLFVAKLAQMKLEAFYGPLALAVALVLWAYFSSLVLVFGALMTPLQAESRGR
jgi:membrane protein/epoxyqueuosine reductase